MAVSIIDHIKKTGKAPSHQPGTKWWLETHPDRHHLQPIVEKQAKENAQAIIKKAKEI